MPEPPMPSLLPTQNGVGPSCIALPVGPWETVLDFLQDRFPHVTSAELVARMQKGEVRDEAGNLIGPETPYTARRKLYYYRHIPDESRIPFEETILFEDAHLVVVDKPHFLPVTPGGRYVQETVLVRIKQKLGIDTLAPMHRIDRETAGLVLLTKQPATRGRYQALFEQRRVSKHYQAIAPWREDLALPMTCRSRLVAENFMRMQEEPGEPNAETEISLLQQAGSLARYRLQPLTGKRHQLRVQMAALGIPILNDQIYPRHLTAAEIDAQHYTKPLQLLAEAIAFQDPITGEAREFVSRQRLISLTT